MLTCRKCAKLKSNGGRCPGAIHHCVVGNYDLFKAMEKEEKLYICEFAKNCLNDDYCPHREKHKKIGERCHVGCGYHRGIHGATCIPYKEEPRGSEYIHIADGLEEELPEPKTKRVGVIWFGEVPVDKCENPVICDEMTGYIYDKVELIDGDLVSEGFGGEIGGGSYKTYKVTYPPTPEPETVEVEDVLKRMPKTEDYTFESQDKYWCDMVEFEKELKDLNEARERQECP